MTKEQSATPAQGKPVAWRWRYTSESMWRYRSGRPSFPKDGASVQCEPLYADVPAERTTSKEPVKVICETLCRSKIFETGQGTCALACMDQLGDARKRGCYHAERIHDKLAHKILEALAEDLGVNGATGARLANIATQALSPLPPQERRK